jgi:hypothetical protein
VSHPDDRNHREHEQAVAVQPQAQTQIGPGVVADHVAVEDADCRDWVAGDLGEQDGSLRWFATRQRGETVNRFGIGSFDANGANSGNAFSNSSSWSTDVGIV